MFINNDFIVSNLNQGVIIEAVYADLVRAFDTVNIELQSSIVIRGFFIRG